MGKINLLDSAVFNRIAAGEVVERPASIVKELVENSIDAGATAISVDIENGGIDLIRVCDNGVGIAPEDVPVAFLPHATSKIKDVEDLDGICTLGFRGEALPSIAAVAHVTLSSRQPNAQMGYGIDIENGVVKDKGERGCPLGTGITVRDVFGNIPARKKFLAKPYVEQNEISNIVVRFIVANYGVSFKYTVDGKIVYSTDGRDMESALYAVYGRDVYDNMLKIDGEAAGVHISGYVGKPYFTKHNRSFQTLIVNGRYVINADVSYAVYEQYADFLMKRQYPVYVLYVQLPPDMVDVNIHPNKLDVKFANFALVKRALVGAIRAALEPAAHRPQTAELFEADDRTPPLATFERQVIRPVAEDAPAVTQIIKNGMYTAATLREEKQRPPVTDLFSPRLPQNEQAPQEKGIESKTVTEKESAATVAPSASPTQIFAECEKPSYKIIGCLFQTYIIAETGEVGYLIDQHAAHERLLFERLRRQAEEGRVAVQPLLIPYVYPIAHTDAAKLRERESEIAALGFEIRIRDTELELNAVPAIVSNLDLKSFLPQLLQSVDGEMSASGLLRDQLMQAACKAAVKGDEELSRNELQTLMEQLIISDAPLYCPHGRPIAVRLERKDLEKQFKRIV